MNCQPGDIAIVIGPSKYAGAIVEVLYAAPPVYFYLPDGQRAAPAQPGCWVLRLISGAVPATIRWGKRRSTRQAWYGVGSDRYLRPLRGLPDEIDTAEPAVAEREP